MESEIVLGDDAVVPGAGSLTDRLDVPLRARNTLLLAAGYAPRYSELDLDDPSHAGARDALTACSTPTTPTPASSSTATGTSSWRTGAAQQLLVGMPAELLAPPMNVYRSACTPTASPRAP